ncbi:MAG: FG-GAP-like repeat-containing protein [Luteolibacter sp.]|uniref:FG-GAP-like repeat-containing protein n=1 Tax=Luteolibacter sp. TaxID=1962973 RepID=UPI0032647FC9
MKTACFTLGWISLAAAAHAATVNLVQNSVDDATGGSIPAVASSQYLETGVVRSTVTAPAVSGGYRFTHWTSGNAPGATSRDAWGRSRNPVLFTLLEDTTFTAHYLPASQDSDGDGLLDWYEIEYFGDLSRGPSFDGDGDGIPLSAESSGGTHPLYGNSSQEGGIASTDSALVTANLAGYPAYTLRSEPAGTVNQSAIVPPGTVVTTPDLTQATFGYWTLDGVPQRDPWGVALRKISFTMAAGDREAVAWFFNGDTDGDGLPDAWEQFHYATLANDGSFDGDGDGRNLLTEYTGGTSPLYGNSSQEGGISWADSSLVIANLAGYPRYTLASDPAGSVNQSAFVPAGTVITTPEMTLPTFGYWELDGVPQRDAWGMALRKISFTMAAADRIAIARLLAADSDFDGIADGYEQYYFGTLANDGGFDGDGDGIPLSQEIASGRNPLYGDTSQEGGISWADSAQIVVNLQPYERLGKALVGGVLTDFFSPDPGSVSGIQAGTWSATAMSDWDGDGDLDLFVAHQNGLRVFRNIGTVHQPDFEEITEGFSALADYIAGIDRPLIAGGDWNGDGKGDLVIGGGGGTLCFIASGGNFSSDGTGPELATGSARALPALGDMNGDGRADLIVVLADGSSRLYQNDGTAMPFGGDFTSDFLGVSVPDATAITTGDINQDGLTDVLLADVDGRIWEFLKNSGGGFTLHSKVWGGSGPGFASGLTLAAVDLEGDGDLDLIGGLANGGIIAMRDPHVGRPTGLTATPGGSSIQLDWDANWQSRISGYAVYRAGADEGPWAKAESAPMPLPGYLDTSVNRGVLKYYQVTSVSYFFLPGNSEPKAVESLPSDIVTTAAGKVALAVRPVFGSPGERIAIQLSIDNAIGVSGEGMQLRVNYDPTALVPLAQVEEGGETVIASGLGRDITFTDNGAEATGKLIIDGSGGALEPGSGMLFTLQFEVAPGLEEGRTLGVSISGADLRDLDGKALAVKIRVLDKPETGFAFTRGDLDGDGLLGEADKTLLMELLLPDSLIPTADQLTAGDLNGDGKLDENDAVLLLQLLNAAESP